MQDSTLIKNFSKGELIVYILIKINFTVLWFSNFTDNIMVWYSTKSIYVNKHAYVLVIDALKSLCIKWSSVVGWLTTALSLPRIWNAIEPFCASGAFSFWRCDDICRPLRNNIKTYFVNIAELGEFRCY